MLLLRAKKKCSGLLKHLQTEKSLKPAHFTIAIFQNRKIECFVNAYIALLTKMVPFVL